ncbi:pyridine nucleotide-disulfide oxidoreductase [Curtobacterium sp. 'Ferrero']|uniref:NAD(P)/FAD-dependent oxidoreductase n=1 Tax=Curtobacterium sp. 'Ferrero' TaxID=2033654 RepID=UPI000BD5FF41|nr:NAD(P)/FAD-dependent oxidoreductase [Curtobacterium sp. 'Ferrero']PCN46583.1 pyridine nucleotide-disulfide oxidoreductase [Curtobacterium sp. 'Ferrero']
MTDAVVHDVDVVVVGAGPAGLSAALNLVRARRSVLLVDANRPRNAATLRSHGFLTRDGVSPLELRKLGRAEVEQYDEATVVQAVVDEVRPEGAGWSVRGAWRGTAVSATARAVVLATGLREEFPALPTLRAFYGTSVHSCVECDGYEHAGQALAFLCETPDVVDRALLIGSWTDDLVVYTNGSGVLDAAGRESLRSAGIRTDDRPVADLEGDRSGLTGVRLADGHVEPRTGAFVRPVWHADLDWLAADVRRDDEGLVVVDGVGRTGVPGLYAVGDVTPPGPEQLIVAAGHGARTAAAVHRDLVGGLTDARDAVQ